MVSPLSSTVVIECPQCKTRLEVLDLHPVSFDYAPEPKRG